MWRGGQPSPILLATPLKIEIDPNLIFGLLNYDILGLNSGDTLRLKVDEEVPPYDPF